MGVLLHIVSFLIFFIIYGFIFYKFVVPKIGIKTKNRLLLYFSYYSCIVIILANVLADLLRRLNIESDFFNIISLGILFNIYFLILLVPFFVILWTYNIFKWFRRDNKYCIKLTDKLFFRFQLIEIQKKISFSRFYRVEIETKV